MKKFQDIVVDVLERAVARVIVTLLILAAFALGLIDQEMVEHMINFARQLLTKDGG